MKTLLAFLLIFALSSCQAIKKTGEVVCDAHHSAAEVISAGGEYLGGPGNLVADILNATLEIVCRVYKAAAAVPADIGDGPGLAMEATDEKEPAHTE